MIAHAMIRVLGAFAILALLGGALHAQTKVRSARKQSALAGQHPAEYYRQAAKLFSTTSRKDDAVFVFYLGQLRYRAHLQARRDLKPDGDPALFGSLSEVVGRPLNEYAFGDLARLADVIDAVLAYDAANPDRFTPPAQFPNCVRRRAGRPHQDEGAGAQGCRSDPRDAPQERPGEPQ
jgi:hypothetical protein